MLQTVVASDHSLDNLLFCEKTQERSQKEPEKKFVW